MVAATDVIGAGEQGSGVTFAGTAEPGATVEVTFEGTTRSSTAEADGNWSADLAALEVPEGQYDGTLSVTVTDAAGNTASETVLVPVETTAFVAFAAADPVEGEGVVNFAEAGAGVVLTGTGEPGATVAVTMAGATHTAIVAGNGTWALAWPSADIPAGESIQSVTVLATDRYGNTDTTTGVIQIDTLAPEAVQITSFTRAGDVIREISVPSTTIWPPLPAWRQTDRTPIFFMPPRRAPFIPTRPTSRLARFPTEPT